MNMNIKDVKIFANLFLTLLIGLYRFIFCFYFATTNATFYIIQNDCDFANTKVAISLVNFIFQVQCPFKLIIAKFININAIIGVIFCFI